MRWFRLAFGPPLTDSNPVLSPDIEDLARGPKKPSLPLVPSPWARPGKDELVPKRKKKRRHLKRRPGPDLEEGSKRPHDGTGWPRPDGSGRS